MKREELKKYLQEKNRDMLESEFAHVREYNEREARLYAYAAGFAPKTTISTVFNIVREVLKEG